MVGGLIGGDKHMKGVRKGGGERRRIIRKKQTEEQDEMEGAAEEGRKKRVTRILYPQKDPCNSNFLVI